MKTRILSIATLALLIMSMVSCDSGVITREPSPETNPSSNKVYFANQSSNLTLSIEADSFAVVIARKVFASALTVDLGYSTLNSDLFTGPKSVTFPAGDSTVTFYIKVGDVELVKQYRLLISVTNADQIDAYTISDQYPTISFNILKEDFIPYAEGTYSSEFFESSWPLVLEHSEATSTYRFSDCWLLADASLVINPGYDVTFKWAGDTIVTVLGGSYKPKAVVYKPAFSTGHVDADYGMVWAIFNGVNVYNPTTKTFTFPITWRVTAGSFGKATDTFEITTVL